VDRLSNPFPVVQRMENAIHQLKHHRIAFVWFLFLTIVFFDRNLLYSLDENKVRPQDSLYWIEMVNKGSGKTDARWDFIVQHWNNISRR